MIDGAGGLIQVPSGGRRPAGAEETRRDYKWLGERCLSVMDELGPAVQEVSWARGVSDTPVSVGGKKQAPLTSHSVRRRRPQLGGIGTRKRQGDGYQQHPETSVSPPGPLWILPTSVRKWDGAHGGGGGTIRDAASRGRVVSVCDPSGVELVIQEGWLARRVGSPASQMSQSVKTREGDGVGSSRLSYGR